MRTIIAALFLFTVMLNTVTNNFASQNNVAGESISGVVRNQQDAPIGSVNILVFDNVQKLLGSAVTDAEGHFRIDNLPVGEFELIAQSTNFQVFRSDIKIKSDNSNSAKPLAITLVALINSNSNSDELTVTATVNAEQDAFEASQQVESVSSAELNRVPGKNLPQVLQEEVGIHIQQNTPGQGSINIRGLSTRRVVTLIDGIRFSTASTNESPTSGINNNLGLLDPSIARRVEIIYGPNSSLYGSDSLAGSINVITEQAPFSNQGFQFHGQVGGFFSSADTSSGGNVRFSLGTSKTSLLVSTSGYNVNDLRTGHEIESHAGVTVNLGLPSTVLGNREASTGYVQYGGFFKFLYKPFADQQLSVYYNHNQVRDINRFDLSGDTSRLPGNLTAASPQILNFFYVHYVKKNLGFLDSLSGTFSVNRQRSNLTFSIPGIFSTDEDPVLRVLGGVIQGTAHLGSKQFLTFGTDLYHEKVNGVEKFFSPQTPNGINVRGQTPNNSRFKSYGLFIQDTVELVPGRLRLNGGVRYSTFFFKSFQRDNPLDMQGKPSTVDSSIRVDDLTFNVEAIAFIRSNLSLVGNISRGFRSPNTLELSGFGVTRFGIEVINGDAQAAGGRIGSSIGFDAQATNQRVAAVKPENLYNYEIGLRFQDKRVRASFTFFNSYLSDLITRRALVLPQGAEKKMISGFPITDQNPTTGVVSSFGFPFIVTTNVGRIRFYGIESTTRINITKELIFSGNFFYLRGEDQNPNPIRKALPGEVLIKKAPDAPELSGGLPPATSFVSLRYEPFGKKYWVEAYSSLASYQDRLSDVDLADPFIGATRSRAGIAGYFNLFGPLFRLTGKNASGQTILLATGETLQQVSDRVLGPGVNRAPFSLKTPGYATFNLRGGFKLGENTDITLIFENILDKSYRIHGAALDAPGRNFLVRYSVRF